jgi:hypothetical protein
MTREEAIEMLKKDKEQRGNCFISDALDMAIKALEQEPCEDAISRNAVIQTLNKMDRYTANELTLCDTDKKFPANEVFIVDDVYEYIAEQLPSVKQEPCEDANANQHTSNALNDVGQHANALEDYAESEE